MATQKPYADWFASASVRFEDLPEKAPRVPRTEPLRTRQLAFGYSQEDLRVLLTPMAAEGQEPTGSMGNDLALAVLSDRAPSLFSYFKQLFAQVTNPAIDPIREKVVMSLSTAIGSELNLLEETREHAHQLVMSQPILRNSELEKLRQVSHDIFRAETIDITWPIDDGPRGMAQAVDRICAEASYAIDRGANIIILSDREVSLRRVPIPSLLAVSSVHNDLVRAGTRLRAGLVIESGEPREVHHMACLIGYGASAINPYLMFESLWELRGRRKLPPGMTAAEAERQVVIAIGKGLLKVLSKMGISTIESYCGAQIFEAVGLHPDLIDDHFTGTPSRIGGVGMDELAKEALDRHGRGYPRAKAAPPPEEEGAEGPILPVGGIYAWRRGGERHMWDPETVTRLQQVARSTDDPDRAWESYERYADLVNEENVTKGLLRGLLKLRTDLPPIPVEDVESAKEIVKRFSTGGMSLGALSPESHEGLAQAMNQLGGQSNTGEGGEDPRRFLDDRRSSIKQVASGRFGVTVEYLPLRPGHAHLRAEGRKVQQKERGDPLQGRGAAQGRGDTAGRHAHEARLRGEPSGRRGDSRLGGRGQDGRPFRQGLRTQIRRPPLHRRLLVSVVLEQGREVLVRRQRQADHAHALLRYRRQARGGSARASPAARRSSCRP